MFPPGWLRQDCERASARVREWNGEIRQIADETSVWAEVAAEKHRITAGANPHFDADFAWFWSDSLAQVLQSFARGRTRFRNCMVMIAAIAVAAIEAIDRRSAAHG